MKNYDKQNSRLLQDYTLFPWEVKKAIKDLLFLKGFEMQSSLSDDELKEIVNSNKGLVIKVLALSEEDKWSPDAIIAKVKGLVVGLRMFLEHVDPNQIEEFALKALQEINPARRKQILTNMNSVYGYSNAAREFAQMFVGMFFEASRKDYLIPKMQLPINQVLEMRILNVFSTQTYNCLRNAEVYTISDLMEFIKEDKNSLFGLRHFGERSMKEIDAFIQIYKIHKLN